MKNRKLVVCYGSSHKNYSSGTEIEIFFFLASDEMTVGFSSGGWRLSPCYFRVYCFPLGIILKQWIEEKKNQDFSKSSSSLV